MLARLPNFFVWSRSPLRGLSSLSVWLLIIQRQTDLRSSAAAAKEKQERWRSSIRATGRTHERQLLGRIARGEDRSSEFFPLPISFSRARFPSYFGWAFRGLRERRCGRSWDIGESLVNDLERTDLASPFLVLVQLREDGSQEPVGGFILLAPAGSRAAKVKWVSSLPRFGS